MRELRPDSTKVDAASLLTIIRRIKDGALVRRLSAIRYRMLDHSIDDTVEYFGISTETLRTWVQRWNTGGVDALRTQPRPGRPTKLDPDTKDWVIKQIEGQTPDGSRYKATVVYGHLKKKA